MNPWTRWKALLARKETGEALAVMRVIMGFGAFWSLVVPIRHGAWKLVWTNAGYLERLPDPDTVALVMGLGILASLSLMLGFFGRASAFITLQCCLYLYNLNGADAGAHDRYINNALWLLVLADSTATWSVDCRRKTGSWTSDRPVSAWPRYVAVFQMVLAYWATGVQKVSLEWTPFGDFTALWYILRSPLYMRFEGEWMPFGFTQFATALTWLWEWGAPIWLYAFWARDKKPPTHWANRFDLRSVWAFFGIGMHLTLFVMTVLGPLQWATVAWYTALYHPDEYKRLFRRLRRSPKPRASA